MKAYVKESGNFVYIGEVENYQEAIQLGHELCEYYGKDLYMHVENGKLVYEEWTGKEKYKPIRKKADYVRGRLKIW